jgi:thymidylate kinase
MAQKYIIIEGMDRCGKDTQIALIQKKFKDETFHVFHYAKVPFKTKGDHLSYNQRLYRDMFTMMFENQGSDRNFIFNRSHLGESVYSPKYRDYDGDYVFDIEKSFAETLKDQLILIVLVNVPDILMSRDDGNSLSNKREDISYERSAFIRGYGLSSIRNKKLIECGERNIDTIHQEIIEFIQKSLETENLYEQID